jgi:hypothetical protein
MITSNYAQPCVECGKLCYSVRYYRDVAPTDRGDEIREGYEPYCGCEGDYGQDGKP